MSTHYDIVGDEVLVEHLLFDLIATDDALASWMKQNRDGSSNDETSRRLVSDAHMDHVIAIMTYKSFLNLKPSLPLNLLLQ